MNYSLNKTQTLITFNAWDFIGISDDNWAIVFSTIPKRTLLELIGTMLCFKDTSDTSENHDEIVRTILGYKYPDLSEDVINKICLFTYNQCCRLYPCIPDRIKDLIFVNVHWDENNELIYLLVKNYDK